MLDNSEAYSEPWQTSKMEFFAKIGNSRMLLPLFYKKFHVRCLTGFWIHLYLKHFFEIPFPPLLKLLLNRVSLLVKINIFPHSSSKPKIHILNVDEDQFKTYHQKEFFYILYAILPLFHICHERLQLWDILRMLLIMTVCTS